MEDIEKLLPTSMIYYNFDEYPDAVLEIIDGADQDAIAFKLGLLQL